MVRSTGAQHRQTNTCQGCLPGGTEGHHSRAYRPDWIGTAHNVQLSLVCADEVRAVLIVEGVVPERIAVSTAGESRSRTPARDNVAHQDNRRVELTFQQYEK
jgi:flagellar motor protein MotB